MLNRVVGLSDQFLTRPGGVLKRGSGAFRTKCKTTPGALDRNVGPSEQFLTRPGGMLNKRLKGHSARTTNVGGVATAPKDLVGDVF